MCRDHQGAGAGCHDVVDVSAGVDKGASRIDVTGARGEQEWGRPTMGHPKVPTGVGVAGGVLELVPDLGAHVHVRARRNQHSHDVGMSLRGCPHQRGLPSPELRGVRVGAMLEQRLDHRHTARPRRHHDGSLPHSERGVRVGAGSEQPVDDRDAAAARGHPERRGAEIVGRVGSRSGLEQQISSDSVAAMRGPMEGSRPVAVRRVDVRP